MDSLTQITLGASVGEIVLGKKLGNRAMMWGAVAGTIPDLDVLANFFMDDMGALAFHRGVSHSILFAVVMPWIVGWLVWRLYESDYFKSLPHKISTSLFATMFLVFAFGIFNMIFKIGSGSWNIIAIGISIVGFCWLLSRMWKNYIRKDLEPVEITYKEWVWFFFWTIFTHPLLDCFTTYGTQLFEPFNNYRVSFDNISVADPLYTIWHIIFLIAAMFLIKTNNRRRTFVWLGLGISGVYMLFTIFNKSQVNDIFEQSLHKQGISYSRFMTTPTIFNNILWGGVAESDSSYYYAMYSLLDKKKEIPQFIEIKKNHEYLAGHESDRTVKLLKWFTNGYFNILKNDDGTFQLNDLRFGSSNGDFDNPKNYIFKFKLVNENGEFIGYDMGRPSQDEEFDLTPLFERVKGI